MTTKDYIAIALFVVCVIAIPVILQVGTGLMKHHGRVEIPGFKSTTLKGD